MNQFLDEIKAELDNILHYWGEKTIDTEQGGFYGQIDGKNTLIKDAPKGIILNTRLLWTYSAAYQQTRNKTHLQLAHRAYNYLISKFIDKEQGGVYWVLDYQGNVLDGKKQVYAQAFAIYALSEYYKITQNEEAKQLAIELFGLIEKYSFDPEYGGYLEAFSNDWQLLEDLRLSEKDANEKKTMNTHLHILEGYANLYRIWKDEKLKNQLTLLIHVFLEKILNTDSMHYQLFFEEDWSLKSHECSYGHDIEGSWLVCEAAEVLEDPLLLKRTEEIALKMVDVTLEEGIDTDGGILNEGKGKEVVDTDKHWWPQAEAMVGLANAYQISKNMNYLEKMEQVWDFTKEYIIDQSEGEWFFRVSREGKPYLEEDKVGLWKCPYHNGRGCLELLARLS